MNATTTVTFNWPADTLTPFDRYSDYRAGFSSLLGTARRRLVLYEQDFRVTELGNRDNCARLQAFLVQGGMLTLIARDGSYIATNAPGFLRLTDHFGHQMKLMMLRDDAPVDTQPFTLADEQHYLLRHHSDWPRGEAGSNGQTAAYLLDKTAFLLESSDVASQWRRLDL